MKFITTATLLLIGTASLFAAPVLKQRTAQQDAELKDWIIGIQRLAQESTERADAAEKENATVRTQSLVVTTQLDSVTQQLTMLQAQIDSVVKERDDALGTIAAQKVQLQQKDIKITAIQKQNAFLRTVIGIALGAVGLLICLWLRIPSMGIYGVGATIAAPLLIFTLVRFLP